MNRYQSHHRGHVPTDTTPELLNVDAAQDSDESVAARRL